MEIKKSNEYFMSLAIKEALKAYRINETPIGCIIVKDDKIIARAYNKREKDNLVISHAEINAIKKASKILGDWRLVGCKMYVTLEPCIMCAGAIIQSRIDELYYGAKEPRFGSIVSYTNIFDLDYNHKVKVFGGIKEDICSKVLKDFFKELRSQK